jgi:hypothetical protein
MEIRTDKNIGCERKYKYKKGFIKKQTTIVGTLIIFMAVYSGINHKLWWAGLPVLQINQLCPT